MSEDYRYEGRGFVIPPAIEDRDDTAQLETVRATTPHQITESSESETLAALLDTVDAHAVRIRELAATSDRDGARERVHGAIADLQQLDAHLAEAGRAEHDDIDDVLDHLYGQGGAL